MLLAVLNTGKVIGLSNLPITVMAGMSDISDGSVLAEHARGIRVLQCTVPFPYPRSVLTKISGDELRAYVIDKDGGAHLVVLGSYVVGDEVWKSSSSASASMLLPGHLCLTAAILAADNKTCAVSHTLLAILLEDATLLVADVDAENGGCVMATLKLPNSDYGVEATSILSIQNVNSTLAGITTFLIGLGGFRRRNVVREVMFLLKQNSAPTSAEAEASEGPDTISCLLLPISTCAASLSSGKSASDESVLWPVGRGSSHRCGSLLLCSSVQQNDLQVFSRPDGMLRVVSALVEGLSEDRGCNFAAPIQFTDSNVYAPYVMGSIVSHSPNTARHFHNLHREEGYDCSKISSNILSVFHSLPPATKASDISSLVRVVLCHFHKPSHLFLNQLLAAATEVRK